MEEQFLIEDYQTDAGVIETVDASHDEVRAPLVMARMSADMTATLRIWRAAQRATAHGQRTRARSLGAATRQRSLLMQVDYLGEPTAGNLQLTHRAQHDSVMQLLGLNDINDVFLAPIPQVCRKCPVADNPFISRRAHIRT